MFAALDNTEFALMVLVPVTIVYLVLLFVVFQRSRSFERLWIASGLLTAVYAVWCNQAAGEGFQVRAGQAGIAISGDMAGVLGRIAVLLVLSGLAAIVLNPWTHPAPSSSREEGIRVHQN